MISLLDEISAPVVTLNAGGLVGKVVFGDLDGAQVSPSALEPAPVPVRGKLAGRRRWGNEIKLNLNFII